MVSGVPLVFQDVSVLKAALALKAALVVMVDKEVLWVPVTLGRL
jgi:hypothetical protein